MLAILAERRDKNSRRASHVCAKQSQLYVWVTVIEHHQETYSRSM